MLATAPNPPSTTSSILYQTNVVIVSDHGMTPTNQRERVVYLDNYINLTMVDIVEYSPVAAIWPKPGRT